MNVMKSQVKCLILRMNNKISKRKVWAGIEVTRIKISPEQAVLSCCEVVYRGETFPANTTQCGAGCWVYARNSMSS
jgi:hypothetical protein